MPRSCPCILPTLASALFRVSTRIRPPPVADQLVIPWGGMVHRTGGPWPSSRTLAATSVTSDTIRRGGCRSDRPTEGARGGHNERGRAAGWSAHLLRAFEEGTPSHRRGGQGGHSQGRRRAGEGGRPRGRFLPDHGGEGQRDRGRKATDQAAARRLLRRDLTARSGAAHGHRVGGRSRQVARA